MFSFLMLLLSAILSVRKDSTSQTVASAIAELTALYNKYRDAAQQNAELTDAQTAVLVAHEELVFSGGAADPDQNV